MLDCVKTLGWVPGVSLRFRALHDITPPASPSISIPILELTTLGSDCESFCGILSSPPRESSSHSSKGLGL